MGKKAGLSSANSQEQVKARVSRVKQAPAHDWLARVAMKFEVLEGLYPDSRKAGTNNFDLTPHFSHFSHRKSTLSCPQGHGFRYFFCKICHAARIPNNAKQSIIKKPIGHAERNPFSSTPKNIGRYNNKDKNIINIMSLFSSTEECTIYQTQIIITIVLKISK